MYKNDLIDVFIDLNQKLPFEDFSFDTVLLTDVLEHISKPQQLVQEIARVLRPGEKVIIMVPFFYRLHEVPHDYFRYTEHALRSFCNDAHLTIVHLEPYGGYYDILFDLINKRFAKHAFTVKFLEWFYERIYLTKYYRKSRKKTSQTFPLGYCLVAQRT